MMKKEEMVRVNLGERSYEIHIGDNLPVGGCVADERGLKALLITDSNIDAIYGGRYEAVLKTAGFAVTRAVVPAGEASKNLATAGDLYGRAVDAGLDRSSVIVALGGGVIGDLAGFVAATYLRGIRFIQIPTSLLAMVDSSVGGKTGVNLPQGKNLVGAFYQPVEVVADITHLQSLPEREYLSGLAEVVKYGVIWDAVFFGELEENTAGLLARNSALLKRTVARCCEIKAEVVGMDEKESGIRAILNFGHTLGHALEKESGYGQLLHGEAVALGMVYAAYVSCVAKGFAVEDRIRLIELLKNLGLPTGQLAVGGNAGWAALRKVMTTDKKTMGGIPRFVLVERVGSVIAGCTVSEEMLEKAFQEWTRNESGG